MLDIVLAFDFDASLFKNLLDLFNQLLRELSLFILLLELVLGLGKNLLERGCLQGKSAIVGRHKDVIFDSAFNASLADVESIVGIVI